MRISDWSSDVCSSDLERRDNPVWHIHAGSPPEEEVHVSVSMLLNLVNASNSADRGVLWGFLARYAPGATPEGNRLLDRLVDYATLGRASCRERVCQYV